MRSAPLLLLLVAAAADEEEKEKKWQESLAWNERAAGTPMHSCMHHFITCGHRLGMFGPDMMAGTYYEIADRTNVPPVALVATESARTSGIRDEKCVVDALRCMHAHGADLGEMVGVDTPFSLGEMV